MLYVKLARMAIAVLVILAAFGVASPTRDAAAANGLIWVSFRGVNLMALSPRSDAEFDVELVEGGRAIGRLQAALGMLLDASPFAEAALRSLQERADIFLVYDPGYPTKPTVDVLGERLAKFRPNLFDNANELTDGIAIPVVVGRYLIKWPRKMLAAVLAREVFGYGAQHADGRRASIAERDAKCESGPVRREGTPGPRVEQMVGADGALPPGTRVALVRGLQAIHPSAPTGADGALETAQPRYPEALGAVLRLRLCTRLPRRAQRLTVIAMLPCSPV